MLIKEDTIVVVGQKRLLKIPLFLLLLITSFSSLAESCDDYAKQTANEFLTEINEITQEFNEQVAEYEKQYYASSYPGQADFGDVLAHLLNRFKFHTLKARYDTSLYDMVYNMANDEANVKFCDNRSMLEDALENRADEFEDITVGTLQELEDRVALEDLENDQGLVVISAYSYGYAETIILKSNVAFVGNIEIGPLKNTQYFKVMKMKAGRYYWDRVKEEISETSYRYSDLSDFNMKFDVFPQRLNFVGTFLYEYANGVFSASVADRSVINIRVFEENYPYLANRLAWINGFTPSDPFVSFFQNEKNKAGE